MKRPSPFSNNNLTTATSRKPSSPPTSCFACFPGDATWIRCKTVHVKADIVAYQEEDAGALRQRVLKRLYRTISPLSPTWRFGQALRASHVYDFILSEPGVNYVKDVRLVVDDVPDAQVASIDVG